MKKPRCTSTYVESARKRFFDIILALGLLIILSPLLLILILIIKLTSPGPSIYCRERVGKNGRIIPLFNLRVIALPKAFVENSPNPIGSKVQLTPIGKLMRRLSLDDLPQLLNILYGHLSFVGPRPALPFEISKYNDLQRAVLTCRPGYSGFWKIIGAEALHNDFDEMIKTDFMYMERASLKTDLIILIKTVGLMLRGARKKNENEKMSKLGL